MKNASTAKAQKIVHRQNGFFAPMQIFKVEIRNHMALNEWSGDVHSTHTTLALTKRVFHAFQAAAMVKSVRLFCVRQKCH